MFFMVSRPDMTARLTVAAFLALVQLFNSNSALAEDQVFDAICLPEKKKCRIRVSTTEFKFEDGTILPVRRVVSWGKAGKGTRPDIGMAVGSAILTPVMPLAVFGLFKKKHEYIFEVNHINENGEPQTRLIKFLNKKPQNRFTRHLASITGLAEHSISKNAIDLYKFNKGSIAANFMGREIIGSQIHMFTAQCEVNVSYSCLSGIQVTYPRVTKIVEF